MRCTRCGELDRARATAGVTSSTMGSALCCEKSFQGSLSSCTNGGGGALAGPATVDVVDGVGVRCCTGAVVLRYAGGAFLGMVAVAGAGWLSSSESGGMGGGALRGGAVAGGLHLVHRLWHEPGCRRLRASLSRLFVVR